MNITYVTVAALLSAALLPGQAAPPKGAKALFYDPTSQVSLSGSGAATSTPKPAAAVDRLAVSNQASTGATAVPKANTGLMYYVELIKPNGEILRVNAARVFRSAARVNDFETVGKVFY